jgi:ubiquinol-cytochrome c reductase cytochrome b subunit
MGQLGSFFSDRLGWERHLRPFLEKPLPGDLNWTFTLGSLGALLFAVQAVTGMFLAMYYNPSPDHAYQAIDYIMKEVTLGRVIRGIHHWGAGAMVICVFIHLVSNFFYGAYKSPRELTWMVGVALFILVLAFGFTGYLLPWDQKAYWATVVGTSVPEEIPFIGTFITHLIRGGEQVSGLTLTRFYAIHVLVLPALTLFFILIHIYLVRIHDIAGHWDPDHPGKEKTKRFFPDHLFKSAIVFVVLFSALLMLAHFVEPPREDIAMTPDPAYLPRPEWYYMWLFELLTYFSGSVEMIGTLVIPLGGILVLILLPFFSRLPHRSPSDRPVATAIAVTSLVAVVYLTLMGMEDSRAYSHIALVPDRKLTDQEFQGLKVWFERDCAYCHHILGKGGRREGPDLSNVIAKDRSREWLVRYIRDPKAVRSWTTMPKYDLNEWELNALADFILSLDFDQHEPRIIKRETIIPSSSAIAG